MKSEVFPTAPVPNPADHVAGLGGELKLLSWPRTEGGRSGTPAAGTMSKRPTSYGRRTSTCLERIVAFACASALVAGCASTAGLSTQAEPRSAAQLAVGRTISGTPIAASWPRTDWWQSLNDPQLDRLIEEALAGSPTLRAAEARTRAALAVADTARSALFPQINADAE